jgi:very-short-patch-repair endonuclease
MVYAGVISPLEGEMPGRAEGGYFVTHFPVPTRNRSFAKTMRKVMTEAELKLWNELRAHRLMNLAFRRQMPIAGYIVDFACPTKKLIVEIDGSQHGDEVQLERDNERTGKLEELGWTVLRFWNDDVLRDVDGVCQHIVTVAGLAVPERVP